MTDYIRRQDALDAVGGWSNSPEGERVYQEIADLDAAAVVELHEICNVILDRMLQMLDPANMNPVETPKETICQKWTELYRWIGCELDRGSQRWETKNAEIVRCDKCKYSEPYGLDLVCAKHSGITKNKFGEDVHYVEWHTKNWYCADGESREQEQFRGTTKMMEEEA